MRTVGDAGPYKDQSIGRSKPLPYKDQSIGRSKPLPYKDQSIAKIS